MNHKDKGKFKNLVANVRSRLMDDIRDAAYHRYSLNVREREKVVLSFEDSHRYQQLSAYLSDAARAYDSWNANLEQLIKERAYTLFNRLVLLMQMEVRELIPVRLISRGIEESSFRDQQEFFVALCQGDELGFGYILQQVWDRLALELPALFEHDDLHETLPIPGNTLLWLIRQMADPELFDVWRDDTTLGWLYQYWNDPDRRAVDAKIGDGGKVESHEIAAKTQLFTERYMVEWLVQNSLGAQWLAMCEKNGWDCRARIIIEGLNDKRRDWNTPGKAIPTEGYEDYWKFYVDQEISDEAVAAAPARLEELRILDPAMGSGHFLVYVFDFLFELYREQGEFFREEYSNEQIVDSILTKNLYGIDIDSRTVQIAAAALYIKAKEKCKNYRISRLNIVATDLGISHLDTRDHSVRRFIDTMEDEIGLSRDLSARIIDSLKGADYLGSLLSIDEEINRALSKDALYKRDESDREVVLEGLREFIRSHDRGEDLGLRSLANQLSKGVRLLDMLGRKYDVIVANPPYLGTGKLQSTVAESIVGFEITSKGDLYTLFIAKVDRLRKETGLSAFITMHTWMFTYSYNEFRNKELRENDFIRIAHMGRGGGFSDWGDFDKVMQTTMFVWKMKQSNFIKNWFIRLNKYRNTDKSIYLLNQTNAMIFPQKRFAEIPGSPMIYWWPEEFRQAYLKSGKLFEEGVVRQGLATSNNKRFIRKHWEISIRDLFIYNEFIGEYQSNYKWTPYVMGATGKRWFETLFNTLNTKNDRKEKYIDYINKGSGGNENPFKPFYNKQGISFSYIGTDSFLCRLRKYKSIFDVSGSSIFCDNPEKVQVLLSTNLTGYVSQSINPTINNQVGDIEKVPVLNYLQDYRVYLNRAKELYDKLFESTESNIEYRYKHLSPETFEVEEARIRDDIDKEILSHFSKETADAIYEEIGASPFNYSRWDRKEVPEGFEEAYQQSDSFLELSHTFKLHPDSILEIQEHLSLIHETRRKEEAFKHLSWATGVLLGRFDFDTGGLVDLVEEPDTRYTHPHGLLYLSALDLRDELDRVYGSNIGNKCLSTLHAILREKWGEEKGDELWDEIHNALVLDCRNDWTPAQRAKKDLNTWIRTKAFDMHSDIYKKRPIYFPLVSRRKNFYIWVNIHRWTEGTLNSILANYLKPDIRLITSRIQRLREERNQVDDKKRINEMEREISDLDNLLDELTEFTNILSRIATKGPAPEKQEVEAPFVMDLDEGVMVNSAALHEAVYPLWKDPKNKWWKALSSPSGKKDFDWSHLAMRYWPLRVFEKCRKDPSLAVAHSDYGAYAGRDLFEELHPQAAKKWREKQQDNQNKNGELDFG